MPVSPPWLSSRSSLFLANMPGRAQQAPNQDGGRLPTAPPPIIWPSPRLPDGPVILDTAIQHQMRLTMTRRLNQPWSMAFLPDGRMLVTERPGCLRIVRDGVLQPDHPRGRPANRMRIHQHLARRS